MTDTAGAAVRRRRLELGITQQQLADMAGISVRALRDIEQGRVTRPRPAVLRGIASALGTTEPSPAVRVAVLGPAQIRWGEDVRPVSSTMQRHLLVLLAIQPNTVVSRDEVVDVLWGERPPPAYRSALHSYVGRLQRALDADEPRRAPTVRASRAGYVLTATADQLDVMAFQERLRAAETAQQRADTTTAAQALASALDRWRGPVGADASERLRTHSAAILLQRQRLATAATFADLTLEASPDRVVQVLQPLSTHEPFHEGLHARLMLALAAAGQQHEALATFSAVQTRLRDELGVEPSAELRRAHVQILRQEVPETATRPARSAPVPPATRVPSLLPIDMGGFVGRRRELAVLTRLAESVDRRDRGVAVVAVVGMAGVGKTTLVVRWAHQFRELFPDGQLYVNLRGYDPAQPPVGPGDAARRFLTALDVAPQRIPSSVDAQVDLYRSLLADRRVLVVLDNARDSDQVRPLLPGTPGCMALVTSRNRLTSLVAAEGATVMTLDLMTPADSRRLLAHRIGQRRVAAEPAAVGAIIEQCARLPLALAIAAAQAVARPGFQLKALAADLAEPQSTLDTLDAGDRSTNVRTVLSWSYQGLGTDAARLFRLFGLHPGPDVSAAAIASLVERPLPLTQAAIGELTGAHLLAEVRPGRYRCHDLLGVYAADLAHQTDSDDERHNALHRTLDHYLHGAFAATMRLDPHRQAIEVGPAMDGSIVPTFADDTEALAWFAAEHMAIVAATRRAANAGFSVHCQQLAWATATYFARRGHWHDWAELQELAVNAAERVGSVADRAIAHRGLASAYAVQGRYDDAHIHYQRALELFTQANDHTNRARTHQDYCYVFDRQGRLEEALHHAREALRYHAAAGNRASEARARNAVGWFYAQLGDHQQALTNCGEAIAIFQEIGDPAGEAATWGSFGYIHHHSADYPAAIDAQQRALTIYRAQGTRLAEAETLDQLGDTHDAAGDRDRARAAWVRAAEILEDLNRPEADVVRAKAVQARTRASQP